MMTFSDQIKELKEMHAEALTQQQQAVARIVDCFETHIMELKSDLDNAREDLDNEKALTVKLKGLLDGGLVELVGELVSILNRFAICFVNDERPEIAYKVKEASRVLTKAKGAMP